MLSPEKMRHLTLVVLESDLERTARAIADVGVLHLLDVRRLGEQAGALMPYDIGEQIARLERVAGTVADCMRTLELPPAEPGPADAFADDGQSHDLEACLARVVGEVDAVRLRLRQLEDEQARLQQVLRTLQTLAPLGVPLHDLPHLRYVVLRSGLLPARNLARLRESLGRITYAILPATEVNNGRVLITALCPREDREVLDRALRSVQFDPLEIPPQLSGTPAESLAEVSRRLAAGEGEIAAALAERDALAQRVGGDLQALHARVRRERLMLEARSLMGHSERIAVVAGWVPAVLQKRLADSIQAANASGCVMQWSAPEELEGVRRGRIPVPILLHNAVLIRPFERLLRAYGLPRYGDIEPTPVVALGFLTMFGFMFGDVGQGAVLFAVGYFIYRRMFRYRDYAVILMECGVFASTFGLLYGSIFGVEHWLPAMWLRPMEDTARLTRSALLIGAGFVSLGFGLNLINALRRRDRAALWERNGLLGALAYWTAAGLFVRHLTGGPGAVTAGGVALWLAVPLTLIFFKEPLRALWASRGALHLPSVSDTLASVVQSLVEVLDTVVSTISNTATFIRLAAFALGHAGLFLATFSVADAVAKTGGGTIGALLVIIAGNIVIIALEGMIVAIQSIRLEYYEFFSKFYSGGGEEYRPLRLTSVGSRP